MKRILLVDSSSSVQTEIKGVINGEYELVTASSLSEAQGILSKDFFDLILLDNQHAGGDSYSFCSQLRNQGFSPDVPVIFVSDNNQVAEKLQAFQSGADDYVVKPYEPLELVARVEARLRKARAQEKETHIERGDLTLSVPFQKATLKEGGVEKDLKLTPTEFRLLYFFIKNEGMILSRNQLLTTIWNDDVHVLARTIDKHISTLKRKLASRAGYIQSIHSKGYRFTISNTLSAEEEAILTV